MAKSKLQDIKASITTFAFHLTNQPRVRALIVNLSLLILSSVGSLLPYPFSVPFGFLLTLCPGFILYRNWIENQSDLTERSLTLITRYFLIAFTFSFILSMLILSPLALVALYIAGKVDLRIFTTLTSLVVLFVTWAYPRNRIRQESHGTCTASRSKCGLLYCTLPFVSSIVALLFNVSYMGLSKSEFFIVPDIALYLTAMQSIARGIWPFADLINHGTSLSSGIQTFSIVYYGIVLDITRFYYEPHLFLALINAMTQLSVVSMLFIFLERINGEVRNISAILLFLLITFGNGFVNLFSYSMETFRGFSMPTSIPDRSVVYFDVGNVGLNSLFVGFHHAPTYLVFLFLISLLSGKKQVDVKTAIFFSVVGLLATFFHNGIGLFIGPPFIISIIVIFLSQVVKNKPRSRLVYRRLLHVALILSVVGLLVLYYFAASFFPFLQTRINLKTPSLEIPVALFFGYLGIGVTILMLIGYYYLISNFEEYVFARTLLTIFNLQLLFVLAFDLFRIRNGAYSFAGYFPYFCFNFFAVILACFGVHTLATESESNLKNVTKLIGSRAYARYKREFLIIVITIVVIFSLLNGVAILTSNYKRFYSDFYGYGVPVVNSEELEALKWLIDNTSLNSTMVADPSNWEIAALAGRQMIYSAYRERQKSLWVTSLPDTSGHGNNGTAFSPSSVQGRIGWALQFDGVNDVVEVSNSPSLNIARAITMEAWIQTTQLSEGPILSKCLENKSETNYQFSVRNGYLNFAFDNTEWRVLSDNTTLVNDGNWHHVVATYDLSHIRLYVDGKEVQNRVETTIMLPNSAPLAIGRQVNTSAHTAFLGAIDEVRIYNRRLNQIEIQENMKNDATMNGLVGEWRFEEFDSHALVSEEKYRDVLDIFLVRDLNLTLQLLSKYSATYVIISSLEWTKYGPTLQKFFVNIQYFRPIFRNHSVEIFIIQYPQP